MSHRTERQQIVHDWVRSIFGSEIALSVPERVARFLEEAVELAQAEHMPIEAVLRLVQHIYAKPPGEPYQEVGGVSVTLLAYCAAAGLSAEECECTEIARVLALPPEYFRKRQNVKAEAAVAMGLPEEP